MNNIENTAPDQDFEDEISITDIFIALGQEKITLFSVFILGTCLALAAALLMPRSYVATTVIMPPQQNSGAASALSQLAGLGGLVGGVSGAKSSDEMYVALLKSRSMQDGLIAQFNLKNRYEKDSIEATRNTLNERINVSIDKKSGFITVEATDLEPVFAAQLANAHVGELRKLLTRLAVTEAQQRRMFFEQQVNKTTLALNEAESKFRQAQASSGLVVTQALAEAGVKEGVQLRGQIAAREVQQQTLARFATPQHPDAQRISAELAALRRQLADIEQGKGENSTANQNGTQAVQAYRDVKVQEAVLESLIRQLELARADEAKEGPLLQQVDESIPPEKPSKPKRSMVVIAGSAFSLFLALLLVAIKQGLRKNVTSWQRIRQAWR